MTHRVALAIAFCLTIVAGFALGAIGSSSGLFSWSRSSETSQEALAVGADSWWWEHAQAPSTQAGESLTPAVAATPQVVTEYIYIDQYVRPTTPASAQATRPVAAQAPAPSTYQAPTNQAVQPAPRPLNQSIVTAGAEEGLKGVVVSVYSDGFTLRTKYGDFLLRMYDGTEAKDLQKQPLTQTDIEPGMLLKTKVIVLPGTYDTPNADGSYTAVKISETTREECGCKEVL